MRHENGSDVGESPTVRIDCGSQFTTEAASANTLAAARWSVREAIVRLERATVRRSVRPSVGGDSMEIIRINLGGTRFKSRRVGLAVEVLSPPHLSSHLSFIRNTAGNYPTGSD